LLGPKNLNKYLLTAIKFINSITGYLIMTVLFNKKIQVRLTFGKTVFDRIEEVAYREGIMRHQLIEKAVEYALENNLNIRAVSKDSKVREFLKAPEDDIISAVSAKIYCDQFARVQKIAERNKISIKEYITYAVAYYILYVTKAQNSESKS